MKVFASIIVASTVLAAGLTGCASRSAGVPVAAPVTVTASSAPTPSPPVVTRTVQAPTPTPTRTVVVPVQVPVYVQPQYPTNYTPAYYGPTYGYYSLTYLAYPGPIHSYSSPTDTSSWAETIQANATVPILCSVLGENLNGDHVWDWDGSGWVWDSMIEMGGAEPPRC